MNTTIYSAFTRLSSAQRAQLIGRARDHITNDAFINLLNNIDINSPKKNQFLGFAAFVSIPGLREQVDAWLASVQ